MIKILFVCHGNICRSPMAEFFMKDLVKKAGLEENFTISSAATSGEETGNGMHPSAKRKLLEHGIECGPKAARQLKMSDYGDYDHLIGMDGHNLQNMRRIFKKDPDGKIALLKDFAKSPGDIADPWYTGDFDRTFRDIEEGCKALLQRLLSERKAGVK
jgi:protein-tyrosine phosphatase